MKKIKSNTQGENQPTAKENRSKLRNTKIDLDFFFEDQILNKNLLELDNNLVYGFYEDINTFLLNQIDLFRLKINSLKEKASMVRNFSFNNAATSNSENIKNNQSQIDVIELDLDVQAQKSFEKTKSIVQKQDNPSNNKIEQPEKKKYKKFDYDLLCYNQEELERKRTYRQHFKKNSEGKFQCQECNMQLVTTSHCYQHWNKAHAVETFNCQNCWLGFSTLTDLFCHDFVRHDPDHSIQSSEIVPCEYCGKELKARSTYNKHILRLHLGELQTEMELFKQKYFANNDQPKRQLKKVQPKK